MIESSKKMSLINRNDDHMKYQQQTSEPGSDGTGRTLFDGIRRGKIWLGGLALAGLVLAGAVNAVYAGNPGPVESAAAKTAEQTASGQQEAGSAAPKNTDTQKTTGTSQKADAAGKTDASKQTDVSKQTDAAGKTDATGKNDGSKQTDTSKQTDASKQTDTSGKSEPSGDTGTPKAVEEKVQKYDFTLGFAGDICLGDNYIPMQHLAAIGSDDISDGIDPRYIEIMKGMDLMWINNEFVYSRRGEPLPTKAWTFCGDPDNVRYLKDLGVDIVGLANNHTFDFGEVSFMDTLETLEKAQIPYVGAGRDIKQAAAPVYLETNGFKIAYVAASRAEYTIYTPEATETEPGILWCYDYTRFLESIREAAENADYVIALPHWGVEHSTVLEDEQIYGAHAMIDAGADAVIGAHPHILQGIEYYEGKPILYSLGNFWFDDYDIDTLVAELHIKGEKTDKDSSLKKADIELKLYPGTQSGVYTALADTEEWKSNILQYLEGISVNVDIDDEGVVHGDSD